MAETLDRKAARAIARLRLEVLFRREDGGAFTVGLRVGKFGRTVEVQGDTPSVALVRLQARVRELERDGSLHHKINPRSLENLAAYTRDLRARPLCQRGHPLRDVTEGDKQRRCLVCAAVAQARYREKKRLRLKEKMDHG